VDIPLGKQTTYPDHYDSGLLFPVPRSANREPIGITASLPFYGYDHWRAYELSWLDSHGMPQAAMADILVPCTSANLVESKSMKLYFNSLNQHRFESREALCDCIRRDLSAVAGADVEIRLLDLRDPQHVLTLATEGAVLLDKIQVTDPVFEIDAGLLSIASNTVVNKVYVSDLFRSNCPVTSQPDWGTVVIHYQGCEPDPASLLRYILSYRKHEGFHEHCVEHIFVDLMAALKPVALKVNINFTRRGGLEINPVRSSSPLGEMQALARFVRQ